MNIYSFSKENVTKFKCFYRKITRNSSFQANKGKSVNISHIIALGFLRVEEVLTLCPGNREFLEDYSLENQEKTQKKHDNSHNPIVPRLGNRRFLGISRKIIENSCFL